MLSGQHTVASSVPVIEPVSTIGAGDNFNAGLIWTLTKYGISKKEMEHLPVTIMQSILANGIFFSAEVCMSYENYISDDFASRIK
jgi:fructokinase